MTNQSARQASVRAATGTAESYEGDLHALFNLSSIPAGDFNGRFLAWLNSQIPVAKNNLPDAMASYAVNVAGVSSWNEVRDLAPWWRFGYGAKSTDGSTVYPTWIFDGINQRYAKSDSPTGIVSQVAFNGLLENFTRANTATYWDANGVLQSASANNMRFTHDYVDGKWVPRGILVEEQRTNIVMNNTMVGAVAGTPGTPPTNWFQSTIGLSREVVSIRTERGMVIYRVRYFGTTTSAGQLVIGIRNNYATAQNDVWTCSVYVARVAGDVRNLSQQINVYDASSSFLGSPLVSTINITNDLVRYEAPPTTISYATATSLQYILQTGIGSGVDVDVTYDIALPQMELGNYATSPILTSGAVATRSADIVYTDDVSALGLTAGTHIVKTFVGVGVPLGFSQGATGNAPRAHISTNVTTPEIAYFVQGTMGISVSTATGVVFNDAANVGVAQQFTAPLNRSLYRNGSFVASSASDTGVTSFSVTRMSLGMLYLGASPQNYNNKPISMLLHYPVQLTSAEIQRLTTL